MINYGRHFVDEDDINAVIEVLRSNYLTTGPKIDEFEGAVSNYVGAWHGVAVSSGTAALHCAMQALNVGPEDEVIVPSMTFAATVNCVLYQRATPVFADVRPDNLCIDADNVQSLINQKTKAIIGVDYAGHPCDWGALRTIADDNKISLVADSCHALGAKWNGRAVGTLADLTVFSFHPVKHITTGEGGMIMTDNFEWAERMRKMRNHGINLNYKQRLETNAWFYAVESLGWNYRITDIQCALGISQLKKQPNWLETRKSIAKRYDNLLSKIDSIKPLEVDPIADHAYHLYVVRIAGSNKINRNSLFAYLRKHNIGINVHYIPAHLHPYYKNILNTKEGMCPVAEAAYQEIMSFPMFPTLTEPMIERTMQEILNGVSSFEV